jgi:hypothetical protein
MKALASFILRGPSQAMLVTVAAVVLAMVLPPLSLVSGAAVALTTLRLGARAGAVVLVGSTVFVGALAWLSLGNALPALVFLAAFWLPVWLLSWLLRESRSLAMATLVAGALGLAGVLLTYLLLGDVSDWWQQVLLTLFEPAIQAGGALADREMVTAMLANIAHMMTGIAAAGMVLNAILCLYLARGWQAQLFNPDGFRSEFYALRLGRWPALLTLAMFVAVLLPLGLASYLAGEMVIVLLTLYLLQGLAMIHTIVAKRHMHLAWLVVLYLVMLFVLPQLMAVVAVLGLLDTWLDFRRRIPAAD